MAYAALNSGGKDSTLALWMSQKKGLEISKLITVIPKKEDSYMFHKPNLDLVPKLAESMDIELLNVRTKGEKEKELQDLKEAVSKLNIDGLITGAVASNYQRERIEWIAEEFELEVHSPLWGMDQKKILEILLKNNFDTRIISVAALGLDDTWLGRRIDRKCVEELMDLKDKYRINVAGEGGEYETLVLSAPNYMYDFKIIKSEKEWDGKRGTLKVKDIERV
ncbi:MAG: diphthine--ammonia ligase [Thermoplasmatota archaeon]